MKIDIRTQIWDLLKSKGYIESNRSTKILSKVSDGIAVKYKFSANNLQKFRGDFKLWSVPFCCLCINDGDNITEVQCSVNS